MRKIDTYVNDYIEQAMTELVKNSLMSDEFLDFVQENTKPMDSLMAYYRCAIMEIETKFKVLNEQFSLEYDRNPIESIKTRVKSLDSIIKKVRRKNIPLTLESIEQNINDIAGVRVVCCYIDDVYDMEDMLLRQSDVRLIERTDYIKNPNFNGYRSLHLDVELPVYLSSKTEYARAEIQLRTVAMDFWASLEHDLRYKSTKNIPEDISREMFNCADEIAAIDVRMQRIYKQIQKL